MAGKSIKSIAAAAALAAAACLAPAAVVLDAPGHVAIEGAAVTAHGGDPGAVWRLLDWRGRDTGVSGVFDEEGIATLPPLPTGYYRLSSLANLAVVPEPSAFPPYPLSPIGIDVCASWFAGPDRFLCPWNGGDGYRTVADLVRLAGFAHVRERLRWRDVQPEPWAAPDLGRYGDVAALFAARGVGVMQMFHDAADWTRPSPKLPRDLAALWRFCRDAADAFGERVEAWEFWNEPDKGYAPEPVWDYAAALKAAYLGFKAARPDRPVLLGGLTGVPNATAFEATLFANDAAKFFDVFNWHSYRAIRNYGNFVAVLRENLANAGVPDRAIWVSEFGTNREGHSRDEGAIKGKNLMEHSPEQELIQAEFFPKAEIALRAAGVARDYFFVFCPVNERGGYKVWGTMRRDGTVKPIYAAMATHNREVGAARLLGAIDAGAGIRAWLFEQPDGLQTVVFWSESPLDTAGDGAVVAPEPDFARTWELSTNSQSSLSTNINVNGGLVKSARFSGSALKTSDAGAHRLVDMCGMVSTVVATNGVLALHATRFPSYLNGVRGLRANHPAVPPGRVLPYAPASDENLSIVLRADLNRDDFDIGDAKTLAILKGGTGRMRLQVWNVGDAAVAGVVEAAGAHVEGLPAEPFVVGPRGSGPVEFDLTVSGEGTGPDRETLALSGVFDGRRSSRLAIPLFHERRFEAGAVRVPLACEDPELWQRNDSAQTYRISRDEAEGGAIRFEVAWTADGTDRWFYPVRALDLPSESLAGAKAIEFDVRTAQDKVENDFACLFAMLVFDDGSAREIGYVTPTETWEKRRVLIPADIDPATVAAIRIGGNPQGHVLAFWLRNLAVLKVREHPQEKTDP